MNTTTVSNMSDRMIQHFQGHSPCLLANSAEMSLVSLAAYAGSGGGGGFYTQLQNLQRGTLVYMVSDYHVVAKRNGKKEYIFRI